MIPFGSWVALPTPFESGRPERVDFAALARLVELQVAGGSDGVVAAGTTGESGTLRPDEREAVIAWVVGRARGRLPVLAGIGTSATSSSIALARAAERAGADGLLAITPYYNRPSQRGLVHHFGAIAAASRLPIVLYNVPSRTGVDLLPETAAAVASDHASIVAVKESSGVPERVDELRAAGLAVLCGEDALVPYAMQRGAAGTIGVVGNLFPREMAELVRCAAPGGDERRAAARFEELTPVIRALFLESNPVPLKAALELLGLAAGELRGPLVPLRRENRRELARSLGLGELEE